MKKHSNAGFAAVELIVVVVILAAIVVVGYYVIKNHNTQSPTALSPVTTQPVSPPVTTAVAPQVTSPSGLTSAMQALDSTSVSSSNIDSSQLSTQSQSF